MCIEGLRAKMTMNILLFSQEQREQLFYYIISEMRQKINESEWKKERKREKGRERSG